MGIVSPQDIPALPFLSEQEQSITQSFQNQQKVLNSEQLADFADYITYPAYFLYPIALKPAVPPYDQTSPYQSLPVMFGLGYKTALAAELRLVTHILPPNQDPRQDWANKLLHFTRMSAPVWVYGKWAAAEQIRAAKQVATNRETADALDRLIDRLHDLSEPFDKFWLYDDKSRQDLSFESVATAWLPAYNFKRLVINDLTAAKAACQQPAAQEGLFNETANHLTTFLKRGAWALAELLKLVSQPVSQVSENREV